MQQIALQVRTAAEQLAAASEQISEGAGDMPTRSEQTATSQQRSPSIMAEISGAVEHTAEVAGNAACLTKEHARVAGMGGRFIAIANANANANANADRIRSALDVIASGARQQPGQHRRLGARPGRCHAAERRAVRANGRGCRLAAQPGQ